MKILLGDYMYKNNLTSRQVEIMTGVPKSTINWIANNQNSPRMDTMELLAKGLKIPLSSLYESDYLESVLVLGQIPQNCQMHLPESLIK